MPESVDSVLKEFSRRIEALVREAVTKEAAVQVRAALGQAADQVSSSLGGNGRGRLGKVVRERRSSEDVARTMDRILTYVRANPGQRSEEIGKGLKLSSAELGLPLRRLAVEKKLKTKGVARGTTYAPA